jgi:hypothetical protein
VLAWLAALLLVAAFVGWEAMHPPALPTSSVRITASTPAGQPVYLGVFTAPPDFGRALRVSGVRVFATSNLPKDQVAITPRLCRGGSLGVTTTPASFCASMGTTEGVTLRAGDEIVLEVKGEQPGTLAIDRVRIAYRDGWRRATQPAGAAATVTILSR